MWIEGNETKQRASLNFISIERDGSIVHATPVTLEVEIAFPISSRISPLQTGDFSASGIALSALSLCLGNYMAKSRLVPPQKRDVEKPRTHPETFAG
jgi:hypothetical protein